MFGDPQEEYITNTITNWLEVLESSKTMHIPYIHALYTFHLSKVKASHICLQRQLKKPQSKRTYFSRFASRACGV